MVWLFATFIAVIVYQYGIEYFKRQDAKKQKEYENRKPPQQPESEVEKQLTQLKNEIQKMKDDSAVLNTPDTFAKYSKIQRQLIPKEELQEQLQKQFQEEQEKYLSSWKEEQAKSSRPQSIQKQITIANLAIRVIVFFASWPIYFSVNHISIGQLQPIIGSIGFKENPNGNSVLIWGPIWLVCCNILATIIANFFN